MSASAAVLAARAHWQARCPARLTLRLAPCSRRPTSTLAPAARKSSMRRWLSSSDACSASRPIGITVDVLAAPPPGVPACDYACRPAPRVVRAPQRAVSSAAVQVGRGRCRRCACMGAHGDAPRADCAAAAALPARPHAAAVRPAARPRPGAPYNGATYERHAVTPRTGLSRTVSCCAFLIAANEAVSVARSCCSCARRLCVRACACACACARARASACTSRASSRSRVRTLSLRRGGRC